MSRQSRNRLRFEQLEDRVVMACGVAGGIATALANAARAVNLARNSAPVAATVGAICNTPPAAAANLAHSEVAFTATLTDPTGVNTAIGSAAYESETYGTKTVTKFVATVKGAAANTSYDVLIGDTNYLAGTITTDANGDGKLVLTSKPCNASQLPLPADFPTIVADTKIVIGTDLQGAFVVGEIDKNHKPVDISISRVTATLTDPTGASTATAKVCYDTITINGNTRTLFRVFVKGGTAGEVLSVTAIDPADATSTPIVLGSITLNDKGNGFLVYTTSGKGPKAEPFPAGFPTLAANWSISVGSLSGTLAQATNPIGKPLRNIFRR